MPKTPQDSELPNEGDLMTMHAPFKFNGTSLMFAYQASMANRLGDVKRRFAAPVHGEEQSTENRTNRILLPIIITDLTDIRFICRTNSIRQLLFTTLEVAK